MRGAASIFVVALALRAATAVPAAWPGYMDAAYYFHLATRVAGGQGLTEDVLWNYLTPPLTLPRPAGAYWPPGASVLAAALLPLGPLNLAWQWRLAQVPFVTVSALVVAATYALAARSMGRRTALVSASFVLLSGVYMPYWVMTDTFTPFAALGGAVLTLAGLATTRGRDSSRLLAGAGALAGLAQLVRPDGCLLLAAPVAALEAARRSERRWPLWGAICTLAGYAAGVAPWLVRNLITWGALTPPGTSRALWLRDYGDLFALNAQPDFQTWLQGGLDAALAVRVTALARNLDVLAQPLLYYLVPVAALGAWRLRSRPFFWPVMAYLAVLWVALSLAFPLQSPRGGTFHSLAAVLPFYGVWVAAGLERLVAWAARRRHWRAGEAQHVFAWALVVLLALPSAYFLWLQTGRWTARLDTYRRAAALATSTASSGPVLAVDPPSFWYVSGRSAAVIPSDGPDALFAAAQALGAHVLVVEWAGPTFTTALWEGTRSLPWLICAGRTLGAAVYSLDMSTGASGRACPPGP